ncbi:MAG: DJ-1/PfpI family protein [Oscillospiraceae bacterium]|jgi:transcriptional regulator GlxA family with amidase domain|nr:DJ-1/PfpI family protein [Oscillospiraceae bacterium]
MTDFNIVLFDGFETLDAFGPAEIAGRMPEVWNLGYYSLTGGMVTSSQKIEVNTRPIKEMRSDCILLIPGGMGTRQLVLDSIFIKEIAKACDQAAFVLTVCTGSALLAKTGLLSGRRATSNKRAFEWVKSVNGEVKWVDQARWVVDGRFYTSSGVSAGMDMVLGFISDLHGADVARGVADSIEYIWNADKDCDPFALKV